MTHRCSLDEGVSSSHRSFRGALKVEGRWWVEGQTGQEVENTQLKILWAGEGHVKMEAEIEGMDL